MAEVGPGVAMTGVDPAVAMTEVDPAVAKTEVNPDVVKTEVNPDVVKTEVNPDVVRTEVAPDVAMKEVAPDVATTEVKLDFVKTDVAMTEFDPAVGMAEVDPDVAMVSQLEGKLEDLQKLLDPTEAELKTTKAELEKAQKLLDASLKKVAKLEHQYEKAERYNEDLREQMEKLSSDLHKLKQLEKKYLALVEISKIDAATQTESENKEINTDGQQTEANSESSSVTAECAPGTEETGEVKLPDWGNTAAPTGDNKEGGVSLADSIKAAAEEALGQSGTVWDESSGMYYDYNSGYYYDPNRSLYYEPKSGTYYYFDTVSNTYQFHSQVDLTQYSSQTQAYGQYSSHGQGYDSRSQGYDSRGRSEEMDRRKRRERRTRSKERYDRDDNDDDYHSKRRKKHHKEKEKEKKKKREKEKKKDKSKKKRKKHSKEREKDSEEDTKKDREETDMEVSSSVVEGKPDNDNKDDEKNVDIKDDKSETTEAIIIDDDESEKETRKDTRKSVDLEPGEGENEGQDGGSEPEEGEISDSTGDSRDPSLSSSAKSNHSLSSDESEPDEIRTVTIAEPEPPPPVQIVIEAPPNKDAESLPIHYPPCIRAMVTQSDVLDLGTLFMVTCDGATIGREKSLGHGILIPDLQISKMHASIRYSEDVRKYVIQDHASQNGTFINQQRIGETKKMSEPRMLANGDVLTLGGTTIDLHIHPGKETCDACEPGLVMAKLQETKMDTDTSSFESKEEKEKKRRQQMRSIKKKYGLQAMGYDDAKAAQVVAGYTDKASERRRTKGSDNPYQRDDAPASVHRAISTENKGHKMLAKLGWKEGETLGKSQKGLQTPISVNIRSNAQAGLGSGVTLDRSMDDAMDRSAVKAQRWLKTAQRMDALNSAESSQTQEAESSQLPVVGAMGKFSKVTWVHAETEKSTNQEGLYENEDLSETNVQEDPT